ncbi:M23 family metallopeptidase [Microbacterium sp. 77mftsu3.1]|uniref:M23 family metallopeptidase n=1 Tax=Microbacterium sp. 77mftsu3.1 TaxID=1761802 RepID=UPI0009D95BE7|nr:M23 family metallopeptidase [Microbacterium sp. 77mftsu3.1]
MRHVRMRAALSVAAALLATITLGSSPSGVAAAREDPGFLPGAQHYVAPSPPGAGPAVSLDRGGYEVVVIPSLRMPVADSPISSRFGHRVCSYGPCPTFHKGIDFALPSGSPVRSLAAGTVTFAAPDGDYGNKVVVEHTVHGERFSTVYAHLLTGSALVRAGQQVRVGEPIAKVGNTGLSYGSHLHFEVRTGDVPVDPERWLASRNVAPFPG